jgi:uncharacterized damage-inducible protein DinB
MKQSLDKAFISAAATTLRDGYLPKIKEAVNLLTEEELWQADGEATNSVGNLLLHLSGNVRQYILSGVGGKPDQRNRPLEFSIKGGPSKAVLLSELEKTVLEAFHVLATCDQHCLTETRRIQDKDQVLLTAVFHCVEHFAYHAGQIIYVVKARRHQRFGWYKYLDPAAPGADQAELRPLGSVAD